MWLAKWSVLLVLLAGCGEVVRIEPLVLEDPAMRLKVSATQDDVEAILRAEAIVKVFLDAQEGGDCNRAWGLLSVGYRASFGAQSGGEDAARQQFCEGLVWLPPVFVKRPWREVLLGPRPVYMATRPGEIPIDVPAGHELFFVVQADGGYRAFLLVSEGGGVLLEPFM